MTVLAATLPSPKYTGVSGTVEAWLSGDHSVLTPGWFAWPASSGESPIAVVFPSNKEISRVSVHETLNAQEEEEARTETVWENVRSFVPRTPLGKRLWKLRQQILASSVPLLTWDDIEREVRQRRGERD